MLCIILLLSFLFLFFFFAVLLAYLRSLFHHGYTYEIHCRHALPCVLGHNSFVALAHLKDILCYQARYDSGHLWCFFFFSLMLFVTYRGVGTLQYKSMKHIVKIMTLLVAISALWIGLLQTSIIPRSHTWLVSYLYFGWFMSTPFTYSCYMMLTMPVSTFFPATNIFHCVSRMLWAPNGWSWSDAISNLSSRSNIVAAGSLLFYLFSVQFRLLNHTSVKLCYTHLSLISFIYVFLIMKFLVYMF